MHPIAGKRQQRSQTNYNYDTILSQFHYEATGYGGMLSANNHACCLQAVTTRHERHLSAQLHLATSAPTETDLSTMMMWPRQASSDSQAAASASSAADLAPAQSAPPGAVAPTQDTGSTATAATASGTDDHHVTSAGGARRSEASGTGS